MPAALVAVAVTAALVLAACGGSTQAPRSKTSATSPATSASTSALAWPAPKLAAPKVINLTSRTPSKLFLNPRQDYILRLPRGHVLNVPYGFQVTGGHNIVMVGGTLNMERPSGVMDLTNQTGTVHIEGVRFTGSDLLEGFDLSEPLGATVEFEHVYVATVHGSQSTNHADLIQTWAGPRRLLVDGFVGSTDYQGFFLLPNQHYNGPAPRQFDLRNVYINDRGGYALWVQGSPRVPVSVSHVYVTPNPTKTWPGWWLMPKPSAASPWGQVSSAKAAPAPVIQLARPAGIGYPAAGA
jgi:hypothetical protein